MGVVSAYLIALNDHISHNGARWLPTHVGGVVAKRRQAFCQRRHKACTLLRVANGMAGGNEIELLSTEPTGRVRQQTPMMGWECWR